MNSCLFLDPWLGRWQTQRLVAGTSLKKPSYKLFIGRKTLFQLLGVTQEAGDALQNVLRASKPRLSSLNLL